MTTELLTEILDNQESHTLVLAELVRRLTRVETRVCTLMENLDLGDTIHSTNGPKGTV